MHPAENRSQICPENMAEARKWRKEISKAASVLLFD